MLLLSIYYSLTFDQKLTGTILFIDDPHLNSWNFYEQAFFVSGMIFVQFLTFVGFFSFKMREFN